MWTHRLGAGVNGIAFAPDGATLYTSDYTGRVYAWDTQTHKRRLVTRLQGTDATNTRALALTSLLMMSVGLFAWIFVHRRWPETGRAVTAAA